MKRIYALLDLVAAALASSLFVYPNDQAAVRAFGDALADSQSPYSKHPGDMVLICVGILHEGGSIEAEDPPLSSDALPVPRVVMTGVQWLQAQPQRGPELVREA